MTLSGWSRLAAGVSGVCLAGLDAVGQAASFRQEVMATGLNLPTALAFAPDGRLYVAEKNGAIRLYRDGVLLPDPFASVVVESFSESGMLGIAIDPDYARNGFVYVFATVSSREQQIIRFTAVGDRGEARTVVRDFLPTVGENHNGGCLKFGPDGMLYFSIGDTQSPDQAQLLSSMAGKIGRINPDGTTPGDNPYSTTTGAPRAVYASGFRNPFRFDIAPDGRLFVLDVGSDNDVRTEEINVIRRADNAGWPLTEGDFDAAMFPQFTRPAFTYHDLGSAPTGACFYTGTHFPRSFQGNFFHADFVSNGLFRTVFEGDRAVSHTQVATLPGGPVDIAQGPDGRLYYVSLLTGDLGVVSYVGPADADPPQPDMPASGDAGANDDGADGGGNGVGGASVGADVDGDRPPPLCGVGAPWALGLVGLLTIGRWKRG